MKDDKTASPHEQHLSVKLIKLKLKLKKQAPQVINALKTELGDTRIDLKYMRRGFRQVFSDMVFRGIPFYVWNLEFAKWLKKNKPEIYQNDLKETLEKFRKEQNTLNETLSKIRAEYESNDDS